MSLVYRAVPDAAALAALRFSRQPAGQGRHHLAVPGHHGAGRRGARPAADRAGVHAGDRRAGRLRAARRRDGPASRRRTDGTQRERAPAPAIPARPRHHRVPPAAGRGGVADPGPAGRRHERLHDVQPGVRDRRPGAGRDPGQHGHVRLRRRREARRELHPDDGGVRLVGGRHGCADPGDGLAGDAAAAGLEAGPLLRVHRDVRHRRRDAVHAGAGRSPPARVPVGARGREHPARADGRAPLAAVDRQAGRRHGGRHRGGRAGFARERPRAGRRLRVDAGRGPDRRARASASRRW